LSFTTAEQPSSLFVLKPFDRGYKHSGHRRD
jgi:hypothetical protein